MLLNLIAVDVWDVFHYSRIFYVCLKYSLQKIIFSLWKTTFTSLSAHRWPFKILPVSLDLMLVTPSEEKCDFYITDHQNEVSSPWNSESYLHLSFSTKDLCPHDTTEHFLTFISLVEINHHFSDLTRMNTARLCFGYDLTWVDSQIFRAVRNRHIWDWIYALQGLCTLEYNSCDSQICNSWLIPSECQTFSSNHLCFMSRTATRHLDLLSSWQLN